MQRGTSWKSMGVAGLEVESAPWKLWQKAKELGMWNPAAVDLT